ncbi:hypothetical protein UlMin_004967 [Ulmus minor]
MASIRFISTSCIKPQPSICEDNNHDFSPTIDLTPCDLQLLHADQIQKGLLFRKPRLHNPLRIEQLKVTLSRTLAIFYPLAGRLIMTQNNDKTASFFINCNGEGAHFVHAVADGIKVNDILEPIISPDNIVYSFFPMNGVLNYKGISNPLLAVQVTELVDGIFIGCTINHCVADGTSFWHFFNTWSEISRGNGDGVSEASPFLDRHYLDGVINLPIHLPFSLIKGISLAERVSTPPLQQRVFHFPKEKIAQLKVKANSEIGTNKISSLQALMAHLWVSITRSRHLKPNEEVHYGIVVGLRQRTKPPLPDSYFGNAVLIAMVKSTAGELLRRGPCWAAWQMNKTIASQTNEKVMKFLEDWTKAPQMEKVGALPSNLLITGSSPRFDVYGNDFGWGKPFTVRSGPGNKFDGKLTVFPGAEEGSIDFEACLSPETLRAMAEDEEFMATLAS